MTNNQIKISEKYIEDALVIGVTDKAFDLLERSGMNPLQVFADMSKMTTILLTANNRGFIINTRYGAFSVVKDINNNKKLVITYFKQSSYDDTNRALVNGINFECKEGLIFTMYGLRMAFKNGLETSLFSVECENDEGVIDSIIDSFEVNEAGENEEEQSQKFLDLLDVAEKYSTLAADLERQKAELNGTISYLSFDAIEYNRKDRIAYRFLTDPLDEKSAFEVGMKVDLDCAPKISAEILKITEEEDKAYFDLLLDPESNYSSIPTQGWIKISISNVNKRVQSTAIDNLRAGKAKGKYLGNVLGECQVKGFEEKDLTALESRLAKEKYPPNQSQINAIKNGICSKDIFLVMGPPGTGKTTVILEWVKYFILEEKKRVLISSQNNKAVDNVIARLAELDDIDILRIGSESKIQDEVVPFMIEKKVAELSDSIGAATTSQLEYLTVAAKKLNIFSKLLERYIVFVKDVYDKKALLLREITNRVKPVYDNTIENKYEYERCIEIITDATEEISDAEHYIDNYRKMSFIKRLFSIFRYKSAIQIIEANNSLIEAEKVTARRLRRDYNESLRKIFDELSRIKRNFFDEYYLKYLDLKAKAEYVQSKYPGEYNTFLSRNGDEIHWLEYLDVSVVRDEVMDASSKLDETISCLEDWKSEMVRTQSYALKQLILKSVDLVGATCIGVSSKQEFQNLDFDISIIDEAGQIQIQNVIVPLSVSGKAIMLGDHKQIPPNVDSELESLCEENDVDTRLLGISLFEEMYNTLPDSNKTLLDTQYRMPAEIADIISEWFYDGKYKSFKNKRNMNPFLPHLADSNLLLIDTSEFHRRFESKTNDGGTLNVCEADLISRLLKYVSEYSDIDLRDIGVISAYKSQVGQIKRKLKGVIPNEISNSIVASLDSFQGQERDLIIYSFTRSSMKKARQGRIGFLNELRRLNVAMSRCKKMLIMVGDFNYLSTCERRRKDCENNEYVYEGSEAQFAEFIRLVLSHVQNGNGRKISSKEFIKKVSN